MQRLSRQQDGSEILRYVERHGVVNKDALPGGRAAGSGRRRGGPRYQALLDLHGFTEERAAEELREAVADARRRGYRALLVVHGRGIHSDPAEGAVLQRLVRQMLSGGLSSSVRDMRPAPPAMGGDGATLVYLR